MTTSRDVYSVVASRERCHFFCIKEVVMKKSLCVLLVAIIALFAFGCSTDDQGNSIGGNSDNSTNVSVSEEQRVIDMFETYGSY